MNSDYLVGTVLENRYEILEMIGSGGMATVYKAKCRVLNRFVAIKVLKDSLKYDMDVVKRFNAESRAAAGLSHPNIVQVYDVSEAGGLDYIVMEYVDGITLKDYIKRRGALPWKEACDFAVQIGKALDCAHKNHIIHRDIKPHNVLLKRDGMIKVADFGIAQAATSETRVANNSNLGSVHYISPEQGRGGYTDERSDIYSLGVVLYEMLTGRLPFDGENAVAIALMKLEKEPVDCRIVNPAIPDSVGKIVMKAISKEQFARYQTASEMVADLQALTKSNIKPMVVKSDDTKFETRRLSVKRMEDRKRKKKRGDIAKRIALIVAALVLSVVAIIALAKLFETIYSSSDTLYKVPNVVGMTLEEAQEKLAEAKMNVTVEKEKSTVVEINHVIRQNIEEGREVKENRDITIFVSLGDGKEDVVKKEVSVPKVTKMSRAKAEEKLEEANLQYEITYEYSSTVDDGDVISQSPSADEVITENSIVKLVVSKGPRRMPDLNGLTEEEAKKALSELDLSLGTVTRDDSKAANVIKRVIVKQSIAKDTAVEKGDKVDITVKDLVKKTFTITIPESAPEEFKLKVVTAKGDVILPEATHHKSEESLDVDVTAIAGSTATIKVYIDGKIVYEMPKEF